MWESLVEQVKNKGLNIDDRFAGMLALIKHYNTDCFDILKDLLSDETECMEIRSACALGLGKLGKVSLELLTEYLKEKNNTLRCYVVQAIGMTGENALPILIETLQDEDNDVFYSAADAIGAIGEPAVPYLTKLLDEGSEDAKCVAAWKLGEIRDKRAIPALISALQTDTNNNDIVALSTWALGELSRDNTNNKSIISALYRISRTKNPEIKRHAYIALRKARDYLN